MTLIEVDDDEFCPIEAMNRKMAEAYFPHRWGEEIRVGIRRLVKYGGVGNTSRALVIHGDPNIGKSSAALAQAKGAAYVKLTGGTGSYRAVAVDVLAGFHDRVIAPRETAHDLKERVVLRAKEQKVRALIVDEAHLLVSTENQKVRHDVAEWLKTVLNDLPCGIVFIGTSEFLAAIDSNESFGRRVMEMIKPLAYRWGVKADRNELKSFMHAYDKALPFYSELAESELAPLIAQAGRYKVGYISDLLRGAAVETMERGKNRITREILSLVFDRFDSRVERRARNPFNIRGVKRVPSEAIDAEPHVGTVGGVAGGAIAARGRAKAPTLGEQYEK